MPSNLIQAKNGRYGASRDLSAAPVDFGKLREAIGESAIQPVPEGWFTSTEYSKAWGVSMTTARNCIQKAIEHGVMEKKEFKVKAGARIVPVPHYRIVHGNA